MSWLFDERLQGYPSWRSYFDLIVVAATKPTFFKEDDIPFEPAEEGLAAPTDGFE